RPGGRVGRCHSCALRAADRVQPMLAHPDRDRRQLSDLPPARLAHSDAFRHRERVRARPAADGPTLDDLVDLLGRKQSPLAALLPLLAAPLAARPLPTPAWRSRPRILRRRQRRLARTPLQATLELSDSNLETLVRLNQTPVRHDQVAQPKQQPDSRLAI